MGWCLHLLACVLAISVHTWTAAKNEVFKGLTFKPMGFLVLGLKCPPMDAMYNDNG